MTEFEVLLVPLSVVLGLGATVVLGGLTTLFRARRDVEISWVPIVWAASILLYVVGYFHVLYDINTNNQQWTLGLFASTAIQTSLLYFSAALILPKNFESAELLQDFQRDGRWAIAPLGVLLASAPVTNWFQQPGHRFLMDDALNLVLAFVIVIVLITRRLLLLRILTVGFAVLSVFGWLVLWSAPGRY